MVLRFLLVVAGVILLGVIIDCAIENHQRLKEQERQIKQDMDMQIVESVLKKLNDYNHKG